MRCPKCQFDHDSQTSECLKCGVVFSHYHEPLVAPMGSGSPFVPMPQPVPLELPASPTARPDAVMELKCRALALPLALLVGRLVAGSGLSFVAGLEVMPLHESGHAITAWLSGRWAVPMLWVTMHGEDLSWPIIFVVSAAIVVGGFRAWKARRWGWICAAVALLVVQFAFLNLPSGPLIVFGGDGGAMVLATILIAMFYVPRQSRLYNSGGLRWGLLVIGALALMYVYHQWSGPYENIPFGEIEGVNLSDPSLLTEVYGWSVVQLVDRYLRLATFCFAALAALYVWGLISAYVQMRSTAQEGAVDQS